MAHGLRGDLLGSPVVREGLTLAEAAERFNVARFARSYMIRSQLSLRR